MSEITFEDFQKLDIRIGTVVKAEVPKWSHWVIRLTVDLGKEIGQRTIFAGVMGHYEPKDLKGKQFPFVVNIKPKKIGPEGNMSEGMLLAGDIDDRPVLLSPLDKVPNGTKVR